MPALVSRLASRALQHHPRTPCGAVEAIAVEVGTDADVLVATWSISGDLAALRIPAPDAALDPERLWAHTCCEMFVAPAHGEAYVEWNFSPSGQVARFEFSGYRQRRSGSAVGTAGAGSVQVEARSNTLRIEARAPVPPDLGAVARISLTAVIEDAAGALSYWALRHPLEKPDFHHAGGFALTLPLGPA